MKKLIKTLFDSELRLSYRRLLAWGVGTALCYYEKIGDEAWMWVTIAFIAGEAAKTLVPPTNIRKDPNGKDHVNRGSD